MDLRVQAQKAEQLRKLHHGPRILLLPNAWDVSSARVLEQLGYPAIATTSAGIAFSLGYRDGQRISRKEMLDVVARIARAVRVPVTADMEAGYGITTEDLADTARAVVEAGAVGVNLEDVTGDDQSSQVDTALQVAKIRKVCEVSASLGVPLVVNARTDAYLMPVGEPATRFDRTVERLRAYRGAGAGCLFAPGVYERQTIEDLVRALAAPLNVLLGPASPPLRDLEKMGVARASLGSAVMRATLGLLRRIGKQLLEQSGTYESILDGAIPYAEMNHLMQGPGPEGN